jgi:hypothetical protein
MLYTAQKYLSLAFPIVFFINIVRYIVIGETTSVPLLLLAFSAFGIVVVSIPATGIFIFLRIFKKYSAALSCACFMAAFTAPLLISKNIGSRNINLTQRSFGFDVFIDGEVTLFGVIYYLTTYLSLGAVLCMVLFFTIRRGDEMSNKGDGHGK